MSQGIEIVIYPAHMFQDEVSDSCMESAAIKYADELAWAIRQHYPDVHLHVDIRPAGDTGCDGGVFCEDRDIEEHVQRLYDLVFDSGVFWAKLLSSDCAYQACVEQRA